jgi:hypothetical protein
MFSECKQSNLRPRFYRHNTGHKIPIILYFLANIQYEFSGDYETGSATKYGSIYSCPHSCYLIHIATNNHTYSRVFYIMILICL